MHFCPVTQHKANAVIDLGAYCVLGGTLQNGFHSRNCGCWLALSQKSNASTQPRSRAFLPCLRNIRLADSCATASNSFRPIMIMKNRVWRVRLQRLGLLRDEHLGEQVSFCRGTRNRVWHRSNHLVGFALIGLRGCYKCRASSGVERVTG